MFVYKHEKKKIQTFSSFSFLPFPHMLLKSELFSSLTFSMHNSLSFSQRGREEKFSSFSFFCFVYRNGCINFLLVYHSLLYHLANDQERKFKSGKYFFFIKKEEKYKINPIKRIKVVEEIFSMF